jgi:hypothetical protein
MNELQQVVADPRSEGEELHRLLGTLRANDWSRTTRFKRWTIADVIAHLYFGDYLGITSHRDADESAPSWRTSSAPACAWMAIAQCFAGPPETPPAPGTRPCDAPPVSAGG